MSEILSDLELHIRKQLLRYAVSQAIFCPTCEGILDVRRAVLTEGSARTGIACVSCCESLLERMRERFGADRVADVLTEISVTDGRELHRRTRSMSRAMHSEGA